jgi:hypothetical protein
MSDERNPTDPRKIERGAVTNIAIVAGPTIAVLADHALDALKNRPANEPGPPSPIVLPPGVKTKA